MLHRAEMHGISLYQTMQIATMDSESSTEFGPKEIRVDFREGTA